MRRTLKIHRVLTAQTTALLITTRRIARTAQTTITTSNRCWNRRRRDLRTGPVFFYLTDGNEYKIITKEGEDR